MSKIAIKRVQVLVLITSLLWGTGVWANDNDGLVTVQERERPGYAAMVIDAMVARPLGFAAIGLGTLVWVVTSPITLVTGTIGEAGQSLVLDPVETTLYRCLGCTEAGWRKMPRKVD